MIIKSMGILIGGIFIGAVGAEIICKNYPKTVKNLYDKACSITSGVKEAFNNGYANAIRSQEAAETGA